jgi:hypothetical protein
VKHSGEAATPEQYPCWRGNWRGVDLNRNWPPVPGCIPRPPSGVAVSEEEPQRGPNPFSEAETRALRRLIATYAPDVLLAVHSGTEAVLTPYDGCARTPLNWTDQLRFGRWLVSGGVCPACNINTAPRVLLYEAGGTMTDYVLHWLNVPLVLTLEVYENADAVAELSQQGVFTPELCRDMFVPPDMDAVLEPWDRALRRLADPSDDDYVTLCRMAEVLMAE